MKFRYYFAVATLTAPIVSVVSANPPPMVYSFHLDPPCDPEEAESYEEAAECRRWYHQHYNVMDQWQGDETEETPHNMLEDDTSWPGKREDFSDFLNRDPGPLYNN